MNLARHVGQASSLPVRAASLPPKCSAGKDARATGSQDGCPTTARFMGRPGATEFSFRKIEQCRASLEHGC